MCVCGCVSVFWGERSGRVADAWGNTWSLATQTMVMTPDEMRAASTDFFAKMGAGPSGGEGSNEEKGEEKSAVAESPNTAANSPCSSWAYTSLLPQERHAPLHAGRVDGCERRTARHKGRRSG